MPSQTEGQTPIQMDGTLLLVGAGNMGGAMLRGWLANGLTAADITVLDPSPPTDMRAFLSGQAINLISAPDAVAVAPQIIVMAVKPQVMNEVFPAVAAVAGADTLVISIAAGCSIAGFEKHLPQGTAVVRAMPNTPAAIGRGITVCCANAHVIQAQRDLCTALLEAVGEVAWVDDEALLDPVTAVSGSGPAYVFLLAECLAEAGIAQGLAPQLARRLARATVAGSGELMRRSSAEPAVLRQNVTSPGGTTEAALKILRSDADNAGTCNMQSLLRKAVKAATARSRELKM